MEAAWYDAYTMVDPDVLHAVPRLLRRVEFEQLVEAGRFEDERVELLYGQIVEMGLQGIVHMRATAEIVRVLGQQLDRRYIVFSHSSLALWETSMPEPDVAVVPDGPFREHATRAHLVVEVADSSLHRDTRVKAPLYAEAGIPTYWLVDLLHEYVRVYSRPLDGQYTQTLRHVRGEVLTCDELPQVAVAVADILPPPA